MAVAKVQGATGNGATIVLNGCTAGNALIYQNSFFRASGTGVGEATPADSNGTFSVSRADVPALFTSNELGVGIFHQQNINAGTHTVTPQANTETHVSLTEFSGLVTTGLFVSGSANSNKTSPEVSGLVSQGTGATSTAAATGDLAVIAFCDAGSPGAANIGLTDPVSGYTTLQLANDDLSSVALQHGFQVLGSGGTKSAIFNWTDSASNRSAHAAIATFVAATTGSSANAGLPDNKFYPTKPFGAGGLTACGATKKLCKRLSSWQSRHSKVRIGLSRCKHFSKRSDCARGSSRLTNGLLLAADSQTGRFMLK